MNMADGRGKSIGGIGRVRNFWQIEQGFDHELYLFLLRLSVTDNRLFHFQRSIFINRQPGIHGRKDCNPPRMAQLESRFDIL